MANPTVITVQLALAPFAAVGAGTLDYVYAAGTLTDGDVFSVTGKEVLLVKNGTGTNTITIESEDDEFGRQEDIPTYSLAAGDFAVFCGGLTNTKGWKNSAGQIRVTVSSVEVTLAVIRLPL